MVDHSINEMMKTTIPINPFDQFLSSYEEDKGRLIDRINYRFESTAVRGNAEPCNY